MFGSTSRNMTCALKKVRVSMQVHVIRGMAKILECVTPSFTGILRMVCAMGSEYISFNNYRWL